MKKTPNHYAAVDERPHSPAEDPAWQESTVIFWWDDTNGIGGLQRLGQEPGTEEPTSTSWSFLFTADGDRFRSYAVQPLLAGDRTASAFKAGTDLKVWCDEQVHWEMDGLSYKVRLDATDFYPPTMPWPSDMDEYISNVASDHYDLTGNIQGEAEIKGKKIHIDGLCFREHSWGIRNWDSIGPYTWIIGTVGPELSFAALHMDDPKFGTISRSHAVEHGEVFYSEDVAMNLEFAPDGISLRQGQLDLSAGSGAIPIEVRPIAGVAWSHRGAMFVQQFSRLTVGGKTGFAVLELGRPWSDALPTFPHITTELGWSQTA